MTREEKIICKHFLDDADKTHSCNEYKLLMTLLEQEPTTKNDLAQERYQDLIEYFGDEKVTTTILESRPVFRSWLERLRWNVKRADELARELEQIKSTTKNDLGVDCISKKFMRDLGATCIAYRNDKQELIPIISIDLLPSATPQEPKLGHWIEQENWEDIYYECSECGEAFCLMDGTPTENMYNFCPNCGVKMENK